MFKILFAYDYENTPLSCGNMMESAFRRRPDVQVFRLGEISPNEVDLIFNTEAKAERPRGAQTIWWDIEACSYRVNGEFSADIVLAPYSIAFDEYPKGKTYFCPFANSPEFKNYPCTPTYDLGFVGREDVNREKRRGYLDFLESRKEITMFRTNGVSRGESVSKSLSQAKIILQVSGDAYGGVMETRFFEIGPINVIAADRNEVNREDMDWAALADFHYIAYNSKEELLEKIIEYSRDDQKREKMLRRARLNYQLNHTYDVRARQILETIGFLKGPGLPKFHERRKRWQEWNDIEKY